MVNGVGIDIIEVDRFSRILAQQKEKLLKRIFTDGELEFCKKAANRLAGRFAAKEAFFKALGTGFRGFKWQDVEIKNNDLGAPHFLFSERLSLHLEDLGVAKAHLSISHCKEYAIAQVILEDVTG